MNISLKAEYHAIIYLIGLSLMIVSLPLSRFGLSVAQFTLLGNWLWEMDFKRKMQDVARNRAMWILISLYFMHLIGLLYTTDMDYALKDLRVKLPILALPVIFASTKPIDSKKIDMLLILHLGAVLVATFISFGILLSRDISDIREISPFISHIRLSLNVCLAIFFSGFFIFYRYKHSLKKQAIFASGILWMTAFLFVIESVTGIFVLLFTGLSLLIYGILKINNVYRKLSFAFLFLIIPLLFCLYLSDVAQAYLTPHNDDLKNLEMLTEKGNVYTHDTIHQPVENGSYINLYVCEKELRESWNAISHYDFDSQDKKGQALSHTLIRYLNSKGYRKDALGVDKLNSNDIRNIENGIANYHYAKKISINSRIYKILWEYDVFKRGGNPGGHSLIQRLEFWKVSFLIIQKNFLIGVGTGDVPNAFTDQYEEIDSVMAPEFRHRSHNQFLAIFVTFGIIGLLWFLFTLYYPPVLRKIFTDYRYFVFIITISLSMLVEDTLETQMGVTLYAFFNAFFLFVMPQYDT